MINKKMWVLALGSFAVSFLPAQESVPLYTISLPPNARLLIVQNDDQDNAWNPYQSFDELPPPDYYYDYEPFYPYYNYPDYYYPDYYQNYPYYESHPYHRNYPRRFYEHRRGGHEYRGGHHGGVRSHAGGHGGHGDGHGGHHK